MKARTRSISGAVIMLLVIPIFAGLLACMPEYVPLGNPERARIDADMTGLWYTPGDDELIGNVIFLQPWDKRTWLSVNVFVELLEDLDPEIYDPAEFDMSTYAGFVKVIEDSNLGEESFEVTVVTYKTWLVKLAGETFFTWELRGLPSPGDWDNEGRSLDDPWYWLDLRIDEKNGGRIAMRLIDPDFPPLKESPQTQRGWERAVRKHVDDESMYLEESLVLTRVDAEDEELFSELVFYAMTRDTW